MDDIRNANQNGKCKLHWYARYPHDFEGRTRHLTDSQYRAYSRLVDRYYLHGSLPNDDMLLAAFAGKPLAAWKAIKSAVEAMFCPDWRDPDIEERRAEAQEAYAKRAAAGRQGGHAKAANVPRNDASNATSVPRNDASNALATTTTTTATEKEGPPADKLGSDRANAIEGSATEKEGALTRGGLSVLKGGKS